MKRTGKLFGPHGCGHEARGNAGPRQDSDIKDEIGVPAAAMEMTVLDKIGRQGGKCLPLFLIIREQG